MGALDGVWATLQLRILARSTTFTAEALDISFGDGFRVPPDEREILEHTPKGCVTHGDVRAPNELIPFELWLVDASATCGGKTY